MGASIYLGKVLSAGTKGCNIVVASTTPAIDPDAQTFLTAAGITDATITSAINTLVVDLKGYNIWTKMKAIYPIVGGTAATHKWNLKDPRDLDAAFRLTFSSSWTHSSNGMTPLNAYADTKYNLLTESTTSNLSGGFYSRTNAITSGVSIGAIDGTFRGLQITPKFTDNNTYYGANDSISDGSGNYVTNTQKLFIANREGSGTKKLYRDGTAINTTTPTNSANPNLTVYLGARNYTGAANAYDSREQAFAFLADTLTATDVTNLTTAVNAFQTTLGRQV
jgi:hypothetical protein